MRSLLIVPLLSFLLFAENCFAFQPALRLLGSHRRLTHLASAASTTISKDNVSTQQPPQIIKFQEPKTNTTVVLIGTMHYNPQSIATVTNTVQNLANEKSLASVLVESCDVRWNTTMELLKTKRGQIFEPVLMSEMKAASDVAMENGIPVVLGDQRINVTGDMLGETFRETFVELANPFGGGWGRLINEFQQKAEIALPSGDGYLNAKSILDPRLLIAAPVSFAKYPLSFLARNPISTSIVFAFIGALTVLDATTSGDVSFMDASIEEQIISILSSFAVAGLEFALFGRLMVQVLLYERNEIIAKNILEQCRLYSRSGNTSTMNIDDTLSSSPLSKLFSFMTSNDTNDRKVSQPIDQEFETIYVPDSPQINTVVNKDGERIVLAVLGMAHCNGIVKLLREELVE
ncbi:hypothetical protein CTEN210_04971 [Chaetoceros tenuissimus]|uniref:TraB family protein n=1 Tax=Chaetoceros tenuissimus TaxID=426638 RepID=A0AAD3CPM7_9STRA|nr:hypothetical protein CTEN210_04971 [Chaetoceros tenuissimus]